MEYIGGGLSNKVYKTSENTVIKEPRKGLYYPENTEIGYNIHKQYFGKVIPDSEFIKNKKGILKIKQSFIDGNPVDLLTTTNNKVLKIIELGYKMQKETGLYFDLFGLEGILNLYYHYLPQKLSQNIMRKDSDLLFKFNAFMLERIFNYPKEELRKIIDNSEKPFLAYNLLETEKGDVKMIDFEYKKVGFPLHITNSVFSIITKKAVIDSNKIGKWNKK